MESRDRGVCFACGIDTNLVSRILFHLIRWGSPRPSARLAQTLLVSLGWSQTRAEATVPPLSVSGTLSAPLWEADHVVPVCEGGTNDASNGRTLCCPCHAAETSALLGRRATSRRGYIEGALWT